MRRLGIILLLIASSADAASAGWLLWKHSLVTRRTEGTPRGLGAEKNVDRWDLLNAVDVRKECLAALKIEQKKLFDTLSATYPGEPVSQSTLADGVSATVSAGAERTGAGSAKT